MCCVVPTRAGGSQHRPISVWQARRRTGKTRFPVIAANPSQRRQRSAQQSSFFSVSTCPPFTRFDRREPRPAKARGRLSLGSGRRGIKIRKKKALLQSLRKTLPLPRGKGGGIRRIVRRAMPVQQGSGTAVRCRRIKYQALSGTSIEKRWSVCVVCVCFPSGLEDKGRKEQSRYRLSIGPVQLAISSSWKKDSLTRGRVPAI